MDSVHIKESVDEVVDTVYDINTLDYEDDKLYLRNAKPYNTYLTLSDAEEDYKKLAHESFYPHVELVKVDITEGGKYIYTKLKSTYKDEELDESLNEINPHKKAV